jgi:DNA-directed RNA polymerase specialized sigma24 family protein
LTCNIIIYELFHDLLCLVMKNKDLSQEAFLQLLARLNADPALAGEEYEKLRARLIYFFELKGCRIPAELGDETINRIARKIEEGCEIEDLFKFAYGVARLVMFEYWSDPNREWEQLDERLSSQEGSHPSDEHGLECRKKCLLTLPPEERDLIIKNCTLNKKGKVEVAKALGLTINALRLRVFRIRAKLQVCYKNCIKVREELAS